MPCWFVDTGGSRVEGNVDRNTSIKCNGGEVLVEEGLEKNDLVPVLQEGHENSV